MKKRPENLSFRGIIRTNIAVVMNGVKERKPPAREVLLLPSGRQGRRQFEAHWRFRAALSVFRRKMEAEADKTESTFAEGKYVCGRRLKALP